MSKLFIPKGYKAPLDIYSTQRAISFIKATFQRKLSEALNLKRVSAPLFVTEASGLNDNLSGKERAVTFDIPDAGENGQVVHSLAKWKRLALGEYGFEVGEGLYTDMNAIRRDEELDNIHSIYVDQWDWEKIITGEERTLAYLEETASVIVSAIADTHGELLAEFPSLNTKIKREVTSITSNELLKLYPDMTADERETAFAKEHGTVLVMQIGGKLSNGERHGVRAPDYDDWQLNGDIIFYNEVLERAFEISSMGVRVDESSLAEQLRASGCEGRGELPFHRMLLSGELPLTVGGGIGQSRLCMLMLGSAHIGEVQSSIWDKETKMKCKEHGIVLL